MFKMKAAVLCLLLCSFLAGCKEKAAEQALTVQPGAAPVAVSGTPTEQVQKTIQRYNQLLAQGYENLNMTPLQEVATKDQAEKAYVHMAAIGEGKAKMVSELKKITFTRLEFPQPGKCLTATDEIWDFAYQNLRTGAKEGERKDFLYHVTYSLESQGGRWMITDIVAGSDEPDKQPAEPRRISVDPPLPAGHGASVGGTRN